jgi:hypothetical protein
MIPTSKSISKVLGPDACEYVQPFITKNIHYLKGINIATQLNVIGNYVSIKNGGDYSILETIDSELLFLEYEKYVLEFKNNYKTNNFQEKNKIIWDGRINNLGFYWVDLEKEYCIESMVRMQDCGRVNFGNTTLELREQTETDNVSHMILVYELKSKNIRQIKGKQNRKPKSEYWIYLHNLLIESEYPFNQYVPTYKPENDLLISELPVSLLSGIYSKHPNLNKLNKLT